MKATMFGPASPGDLVPISGYPDATHAFVPASLPPKWDWPADLWPLLLDARTALARLDGTGRHLLHPDLLLRPLQNREALRSSSLEGTFADPLQQALFQVEPKLPQSAEDPLNAYREVFNYSQALRLRSDSKGELPISLRLIRRLHYTLMNGVRGADRNPGEFRKLQNQIGRPPRYVPPPANRIPGLLDSFEKYLHASSPYDPLVNAFLVHYQFEAIHPFMDGNGRVGRLLLAVLIEEWCDLSGQWMYLSAYFDKHKDEYIDRLFRISSVGDWGGWIKFCLQGVVSQSVDAQRRCDRLIALQHEFNQALRGVSGSVRLASIVSELFINPVATVTAVASNHHVTYPTARADLGKLHTLGIIRPISGAPQISYYCPRILQIASEEEFVETPFKRKARPE